MDVEDQVRAAQRGDPVALSVVLRHLAARLRRVCGSIALDRGDDALQESLLVVMRSLTTLREPKALDGWARTIAVRESLRLVTGRRDVPTAAIAEASDHDHDLDLALDVRAALAELSPAHRAILVLRHLEGLSEHQVAEMLSISTGTVKSRTARARGRFAERWQG